MSLETDFLIIGAGPFGLSMSAYCKHNNIPHLIVGKTMDFWKSNMPAGMKLRSGFDWHLDPTGTDTFEEYMEASGLLPEDYHPIPIELYLDYTTWFVNQKGINPLETLVSDLDYDEKTGLFVAKLQNGEEIFSKNVLIAIGFKYFKNIPSEFTEIFPEGSFTHTADITSFENFKSKRCLIIGGRMSAFESAALLYEVGCPEVYISYRHDTPEFTESAWNWVIPLLNKMLEDPNWYRELNPIEKEEIGKNFYREGRLKMEPWLTPRIEKDTIFLLPKTEVVNSRAISDEGLQINLKNGEQITVDHIIMATGFKVDMNNIPFLNSGGILEKLNIKNGYPELDINLQTNIPGLYVTSMAATQDFGLFFGFTVSVNTSAKIIGNSLRNR